MAEIMDRPDDGDKQGRPEPAEDLSLYSVGTCGGRFVYVISRTLDQARPYLVLGSGKEPIAVRSKVTNIDLRDDNSIVIFHDETDDLVKKHFPRGNGKR